MVVDELVNANQYGVLGPRISRAFEYLRQTDLAALEPGRYELEGPALYVLVNEYSTKLPAEGRWEAHRRYIDLHYVVRGAERIGYTPASRLQPGPYDEVKDVTWLCGPGQFVALEPGDFMLLWPGDAHMPGMAIDAPTPVKKVVIKIRV
ncbi:MAG: YhcH/YjgK/YiaL family protein [Acidobacteriota bacterium]